MTTIENKFIQKLIADLVLEGITFSEDQEETIIFGFDGPIGTRKLDNVIFEKNGYQMKIYKGIFFRESGLSAILEKIKVKGDKEEYKATRVSDEIFYQMQKVAIVERFTKICG